MHIEDTTPAARRYIARHRAKLALLAWFTLAPLLTIAWVTFLAHVGIQSDNLNLVSTGIIALATGVAALAFYWGAE